MCVCRFFVGNVYVGGLGKLSIVNFIECLMYVVNVAVHVGGSVVL